MTRVIVAFALFCALCYSTSCLAFSFDDCGSTLGHFSEVSVSGCQPSNDEKCSLMRGHNATISIKFIPNVDISQVKVRMFGIIIDVPVPFPLDKPDACKDPDDGITCPLHKNQEYHYTTTMFVKKMYPSVNVDIKWKLVNDENKNIVCIQFPAKLK